MTYKNESELENDSFLKKLKAKNWKIVKDEEGRETIYRESPLGKNIPDQGFKIAVSAYADDAEKVFDVVIPLLEKENVLCKVVNSFLNLEEQNKTKQVGKFITIYPASDEEAAKIAVKVDRALQEKGLKGPPCRDDKGVGNSDLVFVRGGGLTVFTLTRPDGSTEPDIRTPEENVIDPKTGKPIRDEVWKPNFMPDLTKLIDKYKAETELPCPNCGKLVTTDQKYCGKCGAKIIPEADIGTHCLNCGKLNRIGAKFCAGCGTKIIPETGSPCPHCGKPNRPNASYCIHCGTKIPIAGEIAKEPENKSLQHETKVSETSNIEQATVGAAAAEAIEYKQEEREFEEEREKLAEEEKRYEQEEKKIDEIESREREIENIETRGNEIDEMENREKELEEKEEEAEKD